MTSSESRESSAANGAIPGGRSRYRPELTTLVVSFSPTGLTVYSTGAFRAAFWASAPDRSV
jgi:hypothetical protein